MSSGWKLVLGLGLAVAAVMAIVVYRGTAEDARKKTLQEADFMRDCPKYRDLYYRYQSGGAIMQSEESEVVAKAIVKSCDLREKASKP